MADKKSDLLREDIIEFMGVIYDCLNSTTYPEDRSVYMHDLAIVSGWIIDLSRGSSPTDVASKIVSPQTSKSLGDYWRHGEWGEKEAKALRALQETARSLLDAL